MTTRERETYKIQRDAENPRETDNILDGRDRRNSKQSDKI